VEALLENVLVGVIVAGCVVFSAWRLMSPRLRLKSLELTAPVMEKVAAGPFARLRSQTIGQLVTGTCSACSHNKSTIHRPGANRS
jgi:hypothetical protein